MDVWVDFKNATQEQAAGIFRCFFRAKKPVTRTIIVGGPEPGGPPGTSIDDAELDVLADRFGAAIPVDEFSVASLQGYLLKNKTRPRQCVEEVAAWLDFLHIGVSLFLLTCLQGRDRARDPHPLEEREGRSELCELIAKAYINDVSSG
jgi:hypothetical protein